MCNTTNSSLINTMQSINASIMLKHNYVISVVCTNSIVLVLSSVNVCMSKYVIPHHQQTLLVVTCSTVMK